MIWTAKEEEKNFEKFLHKSTLVYLEPVMRLGWVLKKESWFPALTCFAEFGSCFSHCRSHCIENQDILPLVLVEVVFDLKAEEKTR